MKIQSELHGDMQSQAEMTWPSTSGMAFIEVGGNKTVGPYLPWALETCADLLLVREDRSGRTSSVPVVAPAAPLGSYVRKG